MFDKKDMQSSKSNKLNLIKIEDLCPSSVQPRTSFNDEKLYELAQSISLHGILQPLIVRKVDTKMEIVAGERRYRAAILAKLKQVPCIIMDLVNEKALAIALVENIQRQDLNPIEEAQAYLRLKETLKLNQEEIAVRVGKDRTSIANTMRLLRLPKNVQDMVASDIITMGHARALLALDSVDMMTMMAKKIAREDLSVRKAEGLVRAIKGGYQNETMKKLFQDNETQDPLQKEVQLKLEYALGAKVILKKENNGYAVVIHFADSDQLNGLLETLGVEI